MEGDQERIERTLAKLLDYSSEHNVDQDTLLIMLSLLNLMGLINAMNRGEPGAASGGNNLQALLTPLLGLMAAGMGGGPPGQQGQFNPAALLSMLGGGKGDLSGLLGLLGPLMGMGAPNQAPGQQKKPSPVQREINLDAKDKKDGEVLKWEFGT